MMTRLRRSIRRCCFILLCFFAFFVNAIWAEDLGVIGTVYPIAETDFIQQIQKTIQQKTINGDLARWRSEQVEAFQAAMDRPTPVEGLSSALRTRTWLWDPSIILPTDVRDANGHLLLAAGSHFNPLTQIHTFTPLLFFDGDNPDQVAWAVSLNQQLHGQDHLILINGSLRKTASAFPNHPLYFDQNGRLVQRLGITHIPATVSRAGQRLAITEVAL